ncbi:retinol dehydrogenase 14-like [Oratosquilla oratoria]|uniref:retinol dehydrogenase 14-like n=1 Tax=Oratosquilla oratoria TaxID=337810 RepID=UPI003F763AFA
MTVTWRILLYVAGALAAVAGIYLMSARRRFRKSIKWCTSKASMKGKVVVITGASSGIGKEAARVLARRGARVVMACRNLPKANKMAEEIKKNTGNDLAEVQLLDTSDMISVRKFANAFLEKEKRLDVLILNAGIAGPARLSFTGQAQELTLATNHLGHFLLTNILLGLLKKSSPSRIIVVASSAHCFAKDLDINDLNNKNRPYVGPNEAYNNSKLCNILFVEQLSHYLQGTDVACNALSPGLVDTEIFFKTEGLMSLKLFGLFTKLVGQTAAEGAQTIIHLATSEEVAGAKGEFFRYCEPIVSLPTTYDQGLAKKLWEKSEDMVDLKPEEKHL